MLAYLCGPIEFASDGGKMWRRKLTPFLREDLGHRVYDPAEDEKKNLTDEEAAKFREWKKTDVERFRRVVRKIIQFDLDLIENKADYLICHLDVSRRFERRHARGAHRGASQRHPRLSGDADAAGRSERLDAGLRRPGVHLRRGVEGIFASSLQPRETNSAVERMKY
jgi:hypothetical protein